MFMCDYAGICGRNQVSTVLVMVPICNISFGEFKCFRDGYDREAIEMPTVRHQIWHLARSLAHNVVSSPTLPWLGLDTADRFSPVATRWQLCKAWWTFASKAQAASKCFVPHV